jgi:hypothetical protein
MSWSLHLGTVRPGHQPREGWADESVTVTVAAAWPPATDVTA